MKILSLHCDYIKFKPLKKALKSPEELSEKRKKEIEVKEPLVIMIAVEKTDENNPNLITDVIKEIKDLAKKVNAKNIVLYPYAHLSPSLSKPNFALKTLEEVDKALNKEFKIARAPFGYYKEFELKVKGHPLSELSRDIHFSGELPGEEEEIDYKKLLKEITKTKLDKTELKDNDHRIIGKQMDLFSFNETAPGMVFWHNNGMIIRKQLIEFWRKEHEKAGYQETLTPQILDKKLWQISGHWDKYKENIFLTDYEKREFAVKPMNCPGGILIFKNTPKSYKDLPIRTAELGIVHRQELSGVLGGLFRVIQFTQDDAHIYCTEKQLEQEIINIIELIDKFYKLFKFEYSVELSTRPEKRIGQEKVWDKAESALEKVLKKKKMKFKINKGDGAFYGPKIDFHIKDSLKRTWQLATIQLDFAMPERFDITYKDNKDKLKRPIMLHRVIYGSLERFIGILLEHTNGRLPLWLAPKQIRVINFTDRNNKACEKLNQELKEKEFRTDLDLNQEPIGGKIKQAEIEKIPYIVTIGDREEKANTLAVRNKGKVTTINRDEFIEMITKEVEEMK
ncbi:threonine--tRNA ligase [archaeon]|mgnify:CR=1 FL=1|jgi:threonyl-tRNA synthetase|nr:threonine--tRNA ligase [archaeon]MBT4241429.1 threonine--tRNA ligase [archaeon]MBT4417700.1 threonine--tRNA ligase [archaeon]